MKNNIALIGFMGTGKSAAGQALAKKLGWQFIEVDAVIEHATGKSIPDIFREDGEIAFRVQEIEAIKQISQGKKQVIACGGGVVLNTININRLRETGVLVLLTASPGKILKRTARNRESRPLLANIDDPVLRIKELLKFRKPYYDRAADFVINTTNTDIDEIVTQIIDRLKEDAGFSFT